MGASSKWRRNLFHLWAPLFHQLRRYKHLFLNHAHLCIPGDCWAGSKATIQPFLGSCFPPELLSPLRKRHTADTLWPVKWLLPKVPG